MKTAYIYAKITTDFLFIVSVWDISKIALVSKHI